MRSIFLLTVLFGIILADSNISFNSNDKCGPGNKRYTKTMSADDILNVQFRVPTSSFVSVTDECEMEFTLLSISKSKLEIRFDSVNKYVNDPNVRLEFYDSDEIKVSKKIREVSQAYPVNSTTIIKTTGRFLTIKGTRSVSKSKNYNVEFTIRGSSATTARWSALAATVVVLMRFM